jgi:hypothetical protein
VRKIARDKRGRSMGAYALDAVEQATLLAVYKGYACVEFGDRRCEWRPCAGPEFSSFTMMPKLSPVQFRK